MTAITVLAFLATIPTPPSDVVRTVDLLTADIETTILGAGPADCLSGSQSGTFEPGMLTVGDFNGDGVDDLLVTAHGADGPGNLRRGAGEAYVVFGRAGSSLPASIDLAEDGADVTFLGRKGALVYGQNMGRAVAAGDLDGDGLDDIVLGAMFSMGPADSRPGAGEVNIVFGSPSLTGTYDFELGQYDTIVYGDVGDALGSGVAVGDVNGDGTADLVVGAHNDDDGPDGVRFNAGSIHVLLGGPNAWPRVIDLADTAADTTIYGLEPHAALADSSHIGMALAVGDVDGDGRDDILTASSCKSGPDGTRFSSGAAWLVLSKNLAPVLDFELGEYDLAVYGADARDFLAIPAVGDVNRDGRAEILLGASWASGPDNERRFCGEVYVLYGRAFFEDEVWDLADKSADITIYGRRGGSGLAHAAVAEVLDDGHPLEGADLLLGAKSADGPGNERRNAGEVYVLRGLGLISDTPIEIDLMTTPASVTVFGRDERDGLHLAVGADLDGDGDLELVLGAPSGDLPDNSRTDAGEVYVLEAY
ncbi:MAG: FG-GAP repeat protein [Acidobacteriota bacterium]|nr:MAG: FG-GAP repeat protein [Acidobacteriota bacterium]